MNNIKELKLGIIAAFPIIIGYFTIAMAFGMLSKNVGISSTESAMFSLIVFAGASQFMAINLLANGVGFIQIILATLLMNLRHLLMSASLSVKLKAKPKKWLPLIAFGVTDETFSVAAFSEGKISVYYMLGLEFSSYFAWVLGTLTGYLVGNILPHALQLSLGIGLYAMFTALLVPHMKKSKNIAILACTAGLVNTIFKLTGIVSEGWRLIASIVIVSGIGAVFFKVEGEKEERI